MGCGANVAAAAVTVQSVVLTLALYEGKDGVLLLGRRQGLGERKSLVNKRCLSQSQTQRSVKSSRYYVWVFRLN